MSANAIWAVNRYVEDVDTLKTEYRFCGYCGAAMREVFEATGGDFNRTTGKKNTEHGVLYWRCPNAVAYIGADHDSVYLKEVRK